MIQAKRNLRARLDSISLRYYYRSTLSSLTNFRVFPVGLPEPKFQVD
ncbi:MAG: hypothetical protein QOE33_38 [Acidobacteriota bacterium]|nr:hypothetical protein [Acidobacteriota bacterium]